MEAPELPATTLTAWCYDNMFRNCTGLTEAPELPAMVMATRCYNAMFYGCSSLAVAPDLPATTMADYCYFNLFASCTALTRGPELPATTLAPNCYASMFHSCASLMEAPELPAMTLANSCYNNMFRGCSSLTDTPELPATTMVYDCYSFMFFGCSSLTEPPELPATILANSCYSGMFYACANIKLSETRIGVYQKEYRIPSSGTGSFASGATAGSAFSMMLMGTGGPFTGSPEVNRTYYLEAPVTGFSISSAPTVNGSFTVTVDGAETALAAEGADVTITAAPDTANGYAAFAIVVTKDSDGSDVSVTTGPNGGTFPMPNEPVTVTVTFSKVFDVTVPAVLPIFLHADGSVSVSNGAMIENNGSDTVKIAELAIMPAEGWTLDNGIAVSSAPVNSKAFSLRVTTSGGLDIVDQAIAPQASLVLSYDASIASQSEAIAETNIATVVFTVGWE